MSFWSRSAEDEDIDDFDDYDPTPYSGGYDIHLTYGLPLDPDEETCHPISHDYSEEYYDHETMQYSADPEPIAYVPDNSYAEHAESYEAEAVEEESEYRYETREEEEDYGTRKYGDNEYNDEDGEERMRYRSEYDEE